MSESKKRSTTLKWKAEVSFEGTAEQFQIFKKDIEKHNIEIAIDKVDMNSKDWEILPFHPAGYIPSIIKDFFPKLDQIEKITQGAERMKFFAIKDIPGGIRTPHLHLRDEVILMDKANFKEVLSSVSRNLLEHRIETEEDYFKVMEPITGVRT